MRWEEAKVERLTQNQDSGAGLRSFTGEESGYSAFDSPTAAELEKLATQVWKGGSWTSLTHRAVIRTSARDVPATQKAQLLEKCYHAASIPQVRQISISYGEADKH